MDINRKRDSFQATVVLLFVVLTSLENGVLGQCKKNPVNKVVPEGTKNIQMSCEKNPTQLRWRCFQTSDELENYLINDEQGNIPTALQGVYALNQFGLVILEATIVEGINPFSSAGICIGEYSNKTRAIGAKLTVVRDGPVCTFNPSIPTNGATVLLSCTTTYADHSIHPIRPIITITNGNKVLASGPIRPVRINKYIFVATVNVTFIYSACSPIDVVLTFAPPTDIRFKFLARNAPDYSNAVNFPATSEDCSTDPRNKAVFDGKVDVLLESTRNPQTLQWKLSPTSNELGEVTISDYSKDVVATQTLRYALTKAGLIVRIATAALGLNVPSTSGLYTSKTRNGDTKGAKLVVVSAGPTCESSPGSGSVELKCSFEFSDHSLRPITARITFKRNGAIVSTVTALRTRKDTTTLSATASFVVSNDPSAVDECWIGFNAPLPDDRYNYVASNAPDFSASCNY